ncbi:MAG TPA: DUF4446 family protein [Actinomycetota bacterium]|nr:DUF4446 family protein [Actinomycetota bacterium]
MPEVTLDLSVGELTTALIGVGALALLSFLFAIWVLIRMRRLRREYAILRGDSGERDIFAALDGSLRRTDAVDARLDEVLENQRSLAATGRHALQRFALIRYDAFEDMGGRLSFSAALLDDHGDGLVITSINGRTETRTYAKPVKGLSSDHNLSDEEREAIAAAVGGQDRSEARTPAVQSL